MPFHRSRSRWRQYVAAAMLLALAPCAIADPTAHRPAVWLNHYRLGDLADANSADWAKVRVGLDAAVFYVNTFWPGVDPQDYYLPADQASRTAATLASNQIAIAIECGYFDSRSVLSDPDDPLSHILARRPRRQLLPGVGRETAENEINILRPLWESGFAPEYLVLDDPMRRLTVPGQDRLGTGGQGMADDAEASAEVVAYMRTMREKFPAVKFVVILNFPNWGWKGAPAYHRFPGRIATDNWGDGHRAMESLFAALQEANLSLYAIQADFPWRYYRDAPADAVAATVDWRKRLHDLEHYARAKGVRFHLTANSESGYASAETFAQDSLRYLDAYLAAGGAPDTFLVQSWYPHPKDLLPETTPYTATWLAAQFIARLDEIANGRSPAPVPTPAIPSADRSEPKALCDLLVELDPKGSLDLVTRARRDWIDRTEDPPLGVSAGLLAELLEAAARATEGKPHIGVVLDQNRVARLASKDRIPVTSPDPQQWVVELMNAGDTSRHVTVWEPLSAATPMNPVWIPSGGSRRVVVNISRIAVEQRDLVLQVGLPAGSCSATALQVPLRRMTGPQ